MNKKKFSVLYFSHPNSKNRTSVQFEGWKSEAQALQAAKLKSIQPLGELIDFLNGYEGDQLSSSIDFKWEDKKLKRLSPDERPRNYHLCVFTHKPGDLEKGKLMNFPNIDAATEFARNLSYFLDTKIRMSRDNERGNGMYFLEGYNH